MTLPSPSFPRLDAVAVGAPHNALVTHDLRFHCGDRFKLGDIRSLPDHVVNIERGRVSIVPTVDAPVFGLEVRDPFFYSASTSILGTIDTLPISRLFKPALPPSPALFCGWGRPRGAGAVRAKRRTVFGVGALRRKRVSALNARPVSGRSAIPGRHTSMISARGFINPCKPEIFESTYEPEEEEEAEQ